MKLKEQLAEEGTYQTALLYPATEHYTNGFIEGFDKAKELILEDFQTKPLNELITHILELGEKEV